MTLTVNGVDLSPRLSTFRILHEITYAKTITGLDGTEYGVGKMSRDVITFRLFPYSGTQAEADFSMLSAGTLTTSYLDGNTVKTGVDVRLTTNLEDLYGLTMEGVRYYKGQEITLRASVPVKAV